MNPTIVLIDDDPDVRGVIRALLADDGGFEVVGQAPDGASGMSLAAHLRPDIVLLDLAMPVMDGLSVLPEIRRLTPESRVIVLSAFGTDRTVRSAMAGGALAFVHKGAGLADELIPVLHEVLAARPV